MVGDTGARGRTVEYGVRSSATKSAGTKRAG
jgi:hypothetical protein